MVHAPLIIFVATHIHYYYLTPESTIDTHHTAQSPTLVSATGTLFAALFFTGKTHVA